MDKKAQRILAGFTCAAFVIVAFFSLHRKRGPSRLHRIGLPCLRLHSSGRTNIKTDRNRLV